MAPEVITESTHSKAADVYSFGVVLFELLLGTRPYVGMHYAQIVASITSGRLLSMLKEQQACLPAGVAELLASCLATEPGDRPTFKKVHAKLREIEQQEVAAAGAAEQLEQPHHQQEQQQLLAAAQQQEALPAARVGVMPGSAAVAAVAAAASRESLRDLSVGSTGHTLADVLAAAQQQQQPALGANM